MYWHSKHVTFSHNTQYIRCLTHPFCSLYVLSLIEHLMVEHPHIHTQADMNRIAQVNQFIRTVAFAPPQQQEQLLARLAPAKRQQVMLRVQQLRQQAQQQQQQQQQQAGYNPGGGGGGIMGTGGKERSSSDCEIQCFTGIRNT